MAYLEWRRIALNKIPQNNEKQNLVNNRTARFFSWGGVSAQQPVEPPRYDGAVVKVYVTRLAATVEDVAVEERIPADSLSPEVAVALRIDSLGNFVGWRFLDNTCEGGDRMDLEPATPLTRQVVERAIERMDGAWSPARRADGRAVGYVQRLRFRVPRQRIEQQVNPDPLLFMGEIPGENFFYWVTDRTGYRSDRFPTTGGRVHIRFYVEADGRVTIDEVLRSPDERLTKRVIRAIRRSEGKWTPRKVDGVPQRTAYTFRGNFINESH